MKIGYVYEIVSKDKNITKVYIGSTLDMNRRKKEHKNTCNNNNHKYYNIPLYCFIREHGGWDNWKMIVIESGDCMDKTELECAEQFYIDMYGGIENLLNCCDAINTPEQTKEKLNIARKKLEQRNIDTKRFYCCGFSLQSNKDLQRHFKSTKHINNINK